MASTSNQLTPTTQKVMLNCYNCDFKTDRPCVMIPHLKLHGLAGSVVCDNCFTKFKSSFYYGGFQFHNKNCHIPLITIIEDVDIDI